MKCGIELADRVTTVSETYAREIQHWPHGFGLDAHLRWHSGKLVGIVNGVDTESFDPRTDGAIARRYGQADAIEGKRSCKQALCAELGLAGDGPLFGVVSRLQWLKGIDLLLAIIPALVERGRERGVRGYGRARPRGRAARGGVAMARARRDAHRVRPDARAPHLRRGRLPRGAVPRRAVRADAALRDALRRDPRRHAGRRSARHRGSRSTWPTRRAPASSPPRRTRARSSSRAKTRSASGVTRSGWRRSSPGRWRATAPGARAQRSTSAIYERLRAGGRRASARAADATEPSEAP